MKNLLILVALTLTVSVNAQSKKEIRAQKKAEVRMQRELNPKHMDWHTAQDLQWAEAEYAKNNTDYIDLKLVPVDHRCSGAEYTLTVADVSFSRPVIYSKDRELQIPLAPGRTIVVKGKY